MARLRFPGRPGYRFDRIGVRYGADEARQTTDPTLAIVASIHKGLQRFRDLFGDSDEDDIEFEGFTSNEIRVAEQNLQHAIKKEKAFLEQQAEEQKVRFERSRATLVSLAASGVELPKPAFSKFKKTYKAIVDTGLVVESSAKLKPTLLQEVTAVKQLFHKQNGETTHPNKPSETHVKLKKPDEPTVFRSPVGRPRKFNKPSNEFTNGFENIHGAPYVFGTKPVSKYASAAKQILARATKKLLQVPTHKVGKFVLPTVSSRSSRVIKPNKRFLEDDSINELVTKQPKLSPTMPTPPSTSLFGMGISETNTFSPFQSHGLTLSPFNMNREKGFPAFSAAPQPSGTSSFTDGLANQKPLGSLDQPLIVEGKRPRKPSLIMRMKLVEDDPEDEIRLQQQLSDTITPAKSVVDKIKPEPVTPLDPTKSYSGRVTKSLIAPAKLFTDPTSLSKSFRHKLGVPQPSKNTVVIRQPKLQLNRTALNRSKAALARSLKAQLKREAKLERKKRNSETKLGVLSSAHSPSSTLNQLSPFSKLVGDSAIEKQKSGLFEGIEGGSFSPGSFTSPPATPSTLQKPSFEEKSEDYHASTINDKDLLKPYIGGTKSRCVVCSDVCYVKKNRKLPVVPFCKRCRSNYFLKNLIITQNKMTLCRKGGCCVIHYMERNCPDCRFMKFRAVVNKCKQLGLVKDKFLNDYYGEKPSQPKQKETDVLAQKDEIKLEPVTPLKKHRHKSEEIVPSEKRRRHKSSEVSSTSASTPVRQKHKSGDKIPSKTFSQSKEFINANNLDQPLSVDVGQDAEPLSLSPPQTISSTKSSPGKGTKKTAAGHNDSDRASDDDDDDDKEGNRPRGVSRGPRIKHVCRRAAMVFPQQRATFPEEPPARKTLTLSALPNEEKQQLWAKSKQEVVEDSSSEESNDGKPVIRPPVVKSPEKKLASPRDEKTEIKKETKSSGNFKTKETDIQLQGPCKPSKLLSLAQKVRKRSHHLEFKSKIKKRTRRIRCRECKGCKTPECGVCYFCRDKPKFGGRGRMRKCCIHSVCLAPKIPRRAVDAFIEPKSPVKTYRRDDDDNSGDYRPTGQSSVIGSAGPTTRFQEKKSNSHRKVDGGGDGAKDAIENASSMEDVSGVTNKEVKEQNYRGLDMDGSVITKRKYTKSKNGPAVEATIQMALTEVRNPFMNRLGEHYHSKIGFKRKEKMALSQKQTWSELKPIENETAYCFDVPLKTHLIKADYKENYDIDTAWSHGFALTMTGPSCIRTLCYLCGSSGKQELIFCIVCCQSYHSFCLEEEERPEESDSEDGEDNLSDDNHNTGVRSSIMSWCCRKCQFCHVCGQQNGLLKCHRCKDTYHPECLGPNYPTRPSKKNIWVCTKCVRCKSCGATTPGVGTNATWTYDFSLCYECGKLMDKGNFCPVCHKCYSDDDWESKMVQCAICESWVHAKCEELTDEMYQIVSCLPEEVQFTCRVCSTEKPAYWEKVLKAEFFNGLYNVLNTLMSSKCAQMLLEAGPPRETKKCKQSKEKNSDDSQISCSEDDISANEMTPSKNVCDSSVNEMTPSKSACDSSANEMTPKSICCSRSGDSGVEESDGQITDGSVVSSSSVRGIDEKIVEKCDCAAGLSIGNKNNQSSSICEQSFCGCIGRGSVVSHLNNNQIYSDISVIQSGTVCEKHSSQASPVAGAYGHSNNCQVVTNNKTRATPAEAALRLNHCDSGHDTTQTPVKDDTQGLLAVLASSLCNNKSCSKMNMSNSMLLTSTSLRKDCDVLDKQAPNVESPDKCSLDKNSKPYLVETNLDVNSSMMSPVLTSTELAPYTGVLGHQYPLDRQVSIWETLDRNGEHPRDFYAIKEKIDSGIYKSVEEFSEDMVRIIQALLFENEQYPTRKKQATSVRSIFIKYMDRCFPWFNVNTCKLWEHNRRLPIGMLKDAVLPPTIDHTYAQWLERKTIPMSPQPSPFKKICSPQKLSDTNPQIRRAIGAMEHLQHSEDTRMCVMCSTLGDDLPDHAGRLLYCGQDDWIHINCALWSAEVFEAADGSLQNVNEAISRGKKLRCDLCQQAGATVGCCENNCKANYHFMCARVDSCVFQEDQTIYCKLHTSSVNMELVSDGNFEILRRVCVDVDKIRAKSAWGKPVNPATLNVIIGSCTIESLGILKSFLSDKEDCLYPVDFSCARIYWSTQDTRRRCVYTCRIVEVKPVELPELHIQDMRIIHDQNHPEYLPLESLNLESLGIPNFMKPLNRNPAQVVALSELTEDIIYTGTDEPTLPIRDCYNSSDLLCLGHYSSFQASQDTISTFEHSQLSRSNRGSYIKEQAKKLGPKPLDLSGLSPSTLALLSIKDPCHYIPPAKYSRADKSSIPPVDEELGLVKIAERLNSAASGKQRQTLSERPVLRSPPLIRTSFEHFKYTQPHLAGSKSLSSSPVGFKNQSRQRSNSEERYTSPLSPLASPYACVKVNMAASPPLLPPRQRCTRSESPFTVIKSQDAFGRSESLSPSLCGMQEIPSDAPGDLTSGGTPSITEVIDEEDPIGDDVEKGNLEIFSDGDEELSEEKIQSILETVPSEVLQGSDVKVVVLAADKANLSEEEIMKITLSVIGESGEATSNIEGEESGEVISNMEGVESDCKDEDEASESCPSQEDEGISGDDECQNNTGGESNEVRTVPDRRSTTSSSPGSSCNRGGTEDGSGDEDEKNPCKNREKKVLADFSGEEKKNEDDAAQQEKKNEDETDGEVSLEDPLLNEPEDSITTITKDSESGFVPVKKVNDKNVVDLTETPRGDTSGKTQSQSVETLDVDEDSDVQIIDLSDSEKVQRSESDRNPVACQPDGVKTMGSTKKAVTLPHSEEADSPASHENLVCGQAGTVKKTGTQDTTDEESDFLLLDDLSVSETNEEGSPRNTVEPLSSQLSPNSKPAVTEVSQPTEGVEESVGNLRSIAETEGSSSSGTPQLKESCHSEPAGSPCQKKLLVNVKRMSEEEIKILLSPGGLEKPGAEEVPRGNEVHDGTDLAVDSIDGRLDTSSSEVRDVSNYKSKLRRHDKKDTQNIVEVKPELKVEDEDITIVEEKTEKKIDEVKEEKPVEQTEMVATKEEVTVVEDDVDSLGEEMDKPTQRLVDNSPHSDQSNIHEKIVKKIKAESLARSTPGEEGPFKCPTCKRLYRTKVSYDSHVRDCDFEVSTSDEDEKPTEPRQSRRLDRQGHSGDKSLPPSTPPLNVPLSIIISDEYKDDKLSPSSRDLSDDCSSVQSQDSRRSSLRKSTVTQRNAAPAHLAKVRRRDSKSTLSPDSSTCSSLLSPKSYPRQEKPSPKETMLEAVGLVSRRSLELSPQSDPETVGPVKLQPRISPSSMDEAPKREKKSPAQAGSGRPSIMAGGLPKPGSATQKSIAITYNPVVLQEVRMRSNKPKRPRLKRIWWVEAEEATDEEKDEMLDKEDDDSGDDTGVACRTRQRVSLENKTPDHKKPSRSCSETSLPKEDTEEPLQVSPSVGRRSKSLAKTPDSKPEQMNSPEEQFESFNVRRLRNSRVVLCGRVNDDKPADNDQSEPSQHDGQDGEDENLLSPQREVREQGDDGHKPVNNQEVELTQGTSTHIETVSCDDTVMVDVNKDEKSSESTDSQALEGEMCESSDLQSSKEESNKLSQKQACNEESTELSHIDQQAHTQESNEISQTQVHNVESREISQMDIDSKINEVSQVPPTNNDDFDNSANEPAFEEGCSTTITRQDIKEADNNVQGDSEDGNEVRHLQAYNESAEASHLQTTVAEDVEADDVLDRSCESLDLSHEENADEKFTSPLRRSRRPPSKTAKLSEYLAELKKEEVQKREEVQQVRRRGRARGSLTPQVSCTRGRGRGRPRTRPLIPPAEPIQKPFRTRPLIPPAEPIQKPFLCSQMGRRRGRKPLNKPMNLQTNYGHKDDPIQVEEVEACDGYSSNYIDLTEEVKNEQKPAESNMDGNNLGSDALHCIDLTLDNGDNAQTSSSDTKGESSNSQENGQGSTSVTTNSDVSSTSSSGGRGDLSVKDDDAGEAPPLVKTIADALKTGGQKLRIIIRSPNVVAAQKIGELIKKTALSINSQASEIIVTTAEPAKEDSSSKDDKKNDVVPPENTSADPQDGSDGLKSRDETPLVSRSVTPDSISAAYDIQSDDFSSETSNDVDDYPASAQETDSSSVSKNQIPTTDLPAKKSQEEEDDDDDVVIVKAVGLQTPDKNMSLGAPEVTSAAKPREVPVSTSSSLKFALPRLSDPNSTHSMSALFKYMNQTAQQNILPATYAPEHRQTGHFTTQTMTLSPTGQTVNQIVNIPHSQLSPSRNNLVLSEVSPGHYIIQRTSNPRADLLQDMGQQGLMLQNPANQPGMILQNPGQPGIIFQNTGQPMQGTNQSVLFGGSGTSGLMLQQGNPTILQGQAPLLQGGAQAGLSFISLNPNNPMASTIISPLQPLQSHISPPSLLQTNMGLAPIMQAVTLSATQPLVLGQSFLTQSGMFLPQLATQTMVSQQTGHMDLIRQPPPTRPSSIIIDPHAHMLSSNLNQSLLKTTLQPNPSVNRFSLPTSTPAPNPVVCITQPSSIATTKSVASILAAPSAMVTNETFSSTQVSLTTQNKPSAAHARVDGAPPHVNYMGTLDLSSSSFQSAVKDQPFSHDASQTILGLVQRALKNKGQEQIPGVEVKSAITNTPQGPKKVLRVFINEEILPNNNQFKPPTSVSCVTQDSSSLSTEYPSMSQCPSTSQANLEPQWTKILPSQSGPQKQEDQIKPQEANLWSGTNTGYISIPISTGNKPQTKSPFRRALKPSLPLQNFKRKLSSGSNSVDDAPPAKCPIYDKTMKSDGTYSCTLQQVVGRSIVPQSNSISEIKALLSNKPPEVRGEAVVPSEGSNSERPTHHIAQQEQHPLSSPHKRASFPATSQKGQSSSQAIKGRARKQILKKSSLMSEPQGFGFKPPQVEMRKKAGGPRRLKTASSQGSHHPLIHHKKGLISLPQPTLEEEVVATPLDQGKDHPHGPGGKGDKEKYESRLRFEISSDDGFSCQGDTVEDAWNQVLEKVQDVRAASRMKQLSYAGICGRSMLGIDHDAVVYLIEQLYGAVHCHRNYKFKFHKYDLDQADAEVALNPTGAARSEAFTSRKPFDMFNFLKSVYRTKPGDEEREKEEEMTLKSSRRATSLSLPMAMRFRKLKTFAKEAVDVYRSKIHGRGLFCKRNIDAGEMVIEYAGEVIRASLTDKREKYYESKGIGCYMFRIDDDEVVDATMHGSAARFINHSCEPNCFSKVILVDGKKHIVIFAMRPIKRGEELTYDYKFPIEEVKIPCSCGSKRCRKYLN